MRLFPVLAAAVLLCGPALAAERKVAVFDFELNDTSLDGQMRGVQPAETARLERLAPALVAKFDAEPGFAAVDTAPVEKRAASQHLQACGGCDVTLAKSVGADLAVTGEVQKVSNLILNINVYVRDTGTGKKVAGGSADIRGNTDESWSRGIDYLYRNVLKKQLEALR
ncbi:DUF3280 domain-containing protein [Mangrovibrevibacter kandeliae]|uniref:DUF3280 domain-containing protein n=1 Tax=Mangrovibrevibacter kandeliae TaxID=2968473 RepID=UPI002117E10F|nr:DUF3280 domain-containing protein [Aurantimonas sp. CSK15Z-1]